MNALADSFEHAVGRLGQGGSVAAKATTDGEKKIQLNARQGIEESRVFPLMIINSMDMW